jgi:hypothetical protein
MPARISPHSPAKSLIRAGVTRRIVRMIERGSFAVRPDVAVSLVIAGIGSVSFVIRGAREFRRFFRRAGILAGRSGRLVDLGRVGLEPSLRTHRAHDQ